MNGLLVAVPDGMDQEGIKHLETRGINVIPKEDSRRMGIEQLASEADAIAVRSGTKVTNVPQNPRVKIYGRIGSGTDNFKEGWKRITEAGIPIVNSPEPNAISVSELVCSYLLDDSRGVGALVDSSRHGEWRKEGYNGSRLHGKTLGIIGVGLIGTRVAGIANAFGMNVLTYDIQQNVPLPPNVKFVSLDDLLRESDYITLHTPFSGTPTIGERQFGLMKNSAVLINTSRGGVVDEATLVKALETGQIRRTYIDVFTTEPFDGSVPENQPSASLQRLLRLPNAYCTPHIGAETAEGQKDASLIIARRLANYLQHGYLDAMCNNHINAALNGLRASFHRAGMFMGQYAEADVDVANIVLDGDLRGTTDLNRNQFISSFFAGLYFSRGRYANLLNWDSMLFRTSYSIGNSEDKWGNTYRVELGARGVTYSAEIANDTGELVGFGYRRKGEEPRHFSTRIGLHENLAILEHDNLPGALALITDNFAKRGVNINNLSNSSQNGRAVTILDLASPVRNGMVSDMVRYSPLQYDGHSINFHRGSSFSLPPRNAF